MIPPIKLKDVDPDQLIENKTEFIDRLTGNRGVVVIVSKNTWNRIKMAYVRVRYQNGSWDSFWLGSARDELEVLKGLGPIK